MSFCEPKVKLKWYFLLLCSFEVCESLAFDKKSILCVHKIHYTNTKYYHFSAKIILKQT